jgi:hypothetical protein
MVDIGVYFSANDVVYDWSIAFLNSFRTFNPRLKLFLLPFNDQCDRLLKLKDLYNFEIYTDPSFASLEAIGRDFELGHTPTGHYWFRRYAAFWGPCDRFMYLDARQVVLADLIPVISALDRYDFDLLHFDCAINQVYEPGELRRDLLKQGRANGFNSGRWVSRRGLFTLNDFKHFAQSALEVRDQLNPRNTDQAFINYCCDIKPLRYGHIADVLGGICRTSWARQSGTIYKDNGRYYLWDYGGLDHKKQLLIIHWAGCRLSARMPQKSLFNTFFAQSKAYPSKFTLQCKDWLEFLYKTPIESLVQNRHLNIFYHHLIQNFVR